MEHHKNIIEYFFLNMQMLGFIFLSAYTNNHYFFFKCSESSCGGWTGKNRYGSDCKDTSKTLDVWERSYYQSVKKGQLTEANYNCLFIGAGKKPK